MVKIMTGKRKMVTPAAMAGQSRRPTQMMVGLQGGCCAAGALDVTSGARECYGEGAVGWVAEIEGLRVARSLRRFGARGSKAVACVGQDAVD